MNAKTDICAPGAIDATAGPTLMDKLPALLRIAGAASLLAAMYGFLMKGWQGGDDILRYLMLLGHTGALAAIGLASGHYLKESKGARLLLSLALVSVPVNFAILGAFIFSQDPLVIFGMSYPKYVAWSVDSLSTALLIAGGAALILAPIIRVGFLTLARSMSGKLAGLYLLSNAALLIPVRDPLSIGLMILLLMLLVLFISGKTATGQMAAKTKEGVLALGLQYLPLAILMGRSLWLYSADLFLLTVLGLVLFITLRQISLRLIDFPRVRCTLEAVSILPAIGVGLFTAITLNDCGFLSDLITLPVIVLVAAGLVYEISLRAKEYVKQYRMLAAGMLVVGISFNLYLYGGIVASSLSVATGIMLAVLGYMQQQRAIFSSGLALMGIGFAYQLYSTLHLFDMYGWASLAVLGVAAILIGSTIESKGTHIHARLADWKAQYGEWEY